MRQVGIDIQHLRRGDLGPEGTVDRGTQDVRSGFGCQNDGLGSTRARGNNASQLDASALVESGTVEARAERGQRRNEGHRNPIDHAFLSAARPERVQRNVDEIIPNQDQLRSAIVE